MSYILSKNPHAVTWTFSIEPGSLLDKMDFVTTVSLECFIANFGKPSDEMVYIDLHLSEKDLDNLSASLETLLSHIRSRG